ncbi:MAG: biosynthetic-type acetolactate synthase large subunit [Candidatus Ancillula sp.]|jgi:acetolactate synthase-1/2/3 large subunit|nr:biosynthetic-type acetolactate synthase large subunit [Candidatus Ancillula sp.]
MKMTGSEAIIKTLEDLGVETVFGLPGGAILSTYDAITPETKFNHVLVRHEQGAGHAASGFAISGKKETPFKNVGVVMVTSGPAATNVVTAIADAQMDSVPLVVITGQVAADLIGTDAFQEADIVGITLPITKHSFLVSDANDIPRILEEAFTIASTGRPGVVLVDVTKTAQTGEVDYNFPNDFRLPGYQPKQVPGFECVNKAMKLIMEAKRPAIYAGGGTVRSKAHKEVLEFAQLLNAPVVTTLQARGIIPDSNNLSLGMVGMHGTITSAAALQNCDLMIVLGARFADRVTGKLDEFAANAKVIQIDIDPAEIGKNREVEAPLYGDIKKTLQGINRQLEVNSEISNDIQVEKTKDWWGYLKSLQEKYPLYLDEELAEESGKQGRGALSPQMVIKKIGEISKKVDPDCYYVAGVGQHQMWASQFLEFEKPGHWVQSAGLGTMGYAVPAGMGVKAANPNNDVWVIDGDGCFQMTNQELATCRLSGLPIKVMIINNGTLGMPRQWQTLFFGQHYSQTDLHEGPDGWDGQKIYGNGEEKNGGSLRVPDFVKLAEAYDAIAIRVTKPEEVMPALERAAAEKERAVVIDFEVAKDAKVFPMVPAGASNNAIMYSEDCQPLLENTFENYMINKGDK